MEEILVWFVLIVVWFGFGWLGVGATRADFWGEFSDLGKEEGGPPVELQAVLFLSGPLGLISAWLGMLFCGRRPFAKGFRWRF